MVWVSKERLAILLDNEGHLTGAPELVVEVLSPGVQNERRDAYGGPSQTKIICF